MADSPSNKGGFIDKLRNIGPAAIIAAAFVGPGTVTTASMIGITYEYALIWSLIFSGILSVILYEKTAKIGIIGQTSLAEAVREQIENPTIKWLVIILTISALAIGNSAFVVSNVLGAALGLQTFTGGNTTPLVIIVGLIAIGILLKGSYKLVERLLVWLVLVMTLSFVITAIAIKPNIGGILKGALIPSTPAGSMPYILGLIGTTLGGYQFFLHSSTTRERWNKPEDLEEARFDVYVSMGLGVLISIAIIITAASLYGSDINFSYGAMELAEQLKPTLGSAAPYIFSLGLFAASISSAVPTALATAYAVSGLLGWEVDLNDNKFKAIEVIFLSVVTLVAAFGSRPLAWILFAQATNGLLLPISAILVLWVVNRKNLLGEYVPKPWENYLTGAAILVIAYLGLTSFGEVFANFL